jgi:hypothetical protein
MDRFGVGRAALFGSAPGEQGAVARAVRAYPDRFVGFQMFHPRAGKIEELSEMRGVLLFPSMGSFFPDDPICRPVYESGKAVFVHLGPLRIAIREKLGLPGAFDEKFGDPVRLVTVLREHPQVPFIVPHFGNGLLAELIRHARGCRNLYLDTSSSNEWMKRTPEYPDLKSVFRAAIDAFGPDRLLFGSDSTVFPRGWRKDVYDAQRAAVAELRLSGSEVDAIFGGNAQRLLSSRS